MSFQASQSANQVSQDEVETVDEPSMEEILASIKQIISEDSDGAETLNDREQYTHPDNPSNSNTVDAPASAAAASVADPAASAEDNALEVGLKAAMDEEMLAMQMSEAVAEQIEAITPPIVEVEAVQPPEAPADLPPAETVEPAESEEIAATAAPAEAAETAIATGPAETGGLKPAPMPASMEPGLSVAEKAARLRAENAESLDGLTADERLEKYRVRGKLAMERLAQRQPAPFVKAAEPVQPSVADAVAAGPILPTTQAVAEEMAATMMSEKSAEIETILAGLMRPVIQQWLADNLPSLVEKLVREEIERVSRGKQAS